MKAVKMTKGSESVNTKPSNVNKAKPNSKKKIVVSYKNLPPEIVELVKEKYPKGYSDVLMKIDKGNGQFFYAITLDTEDTDYLIKVDVKIDLEPDEVERALFGGDQGTDDEDFPESDDNFEQVSNDDDDNE